MVGNKIRGYLRIAMILPVSLYYYLKVIVFGWFAKDKAKTRFKVRNGWGAAMCRLLGFRVEFRGHLPPEGTYLFVGNHRASLDPLVCMRYLQASPVSRADVRNYPVIGKGAEMSGIIFVDKESRTSRSATKQAIYDSLKAGKSVMIYPEGKTHAEPLTTTFQKGAFEMAAELGIPVVPFAIEYKSIADYWDHTDTMVVHYLKNLAKSRTYIRMSMGPVIEGDTAWSLLRQSQQWINDEIVRLRADWGGLAPARPGAADAQAKPSGE